MAKPLLKRLMLSLLVLSLASPRMWMALARGDDPASIRAVDGLLRKISARPAIPILERDAIIAQLRELGINTAPELQKYLSLPDDRKLGALMAMEVLQGFNEETLKAVEKVAHEPENEGALLDPPVQAMKIILGNRDRNHVATFGLSVVRGAGPRNVCAVMSWLAGQDQSWLKEDESAQQLTASTCRRLRELARAARTYNTWALTLSFIADRPPFNTERYSKDITAALLSAVGDSASLKKLTDFDIEAAFRMVTTRAPYFSELAKESLLKVAAEQPIEVTQVLLWQVHYQEFDQSEIGKAVTSVSLQKWPELADYVKRLKKTEFVSYWPVDQELHRTISLALYKLWGLPTNAFEPRPDRKAR